MEISSSDTPHAKSRLDARIDQLEARIDQFESSLLAEIHEIRNDFCRHVDIFFDGLRNELRIVANLLDDLNAKVDRLLPPDASH